MILHSSASGGGEQRGRPVAFAVVGHRAAATGFRWQTELRAIKRLDLRLLVDTEHDRMRWRIDIEADDIPQLWHQLGVTRQFELVHPVRLQSCARQMRCTERTLMPTALAIVAALHRVAPPGGSPKVVLVRRMTPRVPRPSSVSSMTRARQTCFCGMFQSATIGPNRT
jgi:hypothetical protein